MTTPRQEAIELVKELAQDRLGPYGDPDYEGAFLYYQTLAREIVDTDTKEE